MESCARCGAPLGVGDRFCGDCGAPLLGCPACGEPATAGKRFCRGCGAQLPAAGPAPAAPDAMRLTPPPVRPAGPGGASSRGPVAERRVCSVLFCDMAGFTPLAEARDPEAVRELLSSYFDVARTVISRYGGVVEKFIGDAVMAVWGTPVAEEGDAERAVRAGLDLVAAVAELGAEAGLPGLAARAGVVTGEVAVTLGAVGEGMVAGDAVNTAARVQSVAEPGSVLADVPTQRLASSGIGFTAAGSHRLKGKTEPQPLWQATRVLSGMGGLLRIDGLEAPLVGRDAELRTVRELFHAAAERRVPRLVLVSGPAGVGKSRLGWEFEKYADGLAETVWWHRGRCLSYGDGVAFWALAEIVRQRLGIAEEDPVSVAGTKLAEGLARFVPDPAELVYAGLRLGRLLGVVMPGDGAGPLSREELFAGWRLFFERLAAQAPVVLLIEDAQYADAGLLDFLDHLIDWGRDLPVFVLVLARPELGQTRPGFGTGRNRITLALDPLDPASMDQLVDALVPGMPTSARQAVTSQAQGIPLFAVETVRALIDRDIVQPVEGSYRLVGDVGQLAVPDSLHALLASRLDVLDPKVRGLVTVAAVLGATFPAEALVAVSGRDEDMVRVALAELVRREVLVVSADPLSPERGNYQFAQQMLRQVAHDTLSRRDRKTLHLKVADHLRTAFANDGEEVADVIAQHYLDALTAVPDDQDAPGIRVQAVAALLRAAERAERTGAPAQAATSYGTAAQLSEDAPGGPRAPADGAPAVGMMWERAAEAATDSGDWAGALAHTNRARDYHQQDGQLRAAARAQARAGLVLRRWGRLAEAREQLTSALEVLRDEPDRDTVTALEQLAAVSVFAGAPEAERLTTEALNLAQALGTGKLSDPLVTRGMYLTSVGRRTEAIAYLREAARLSEQAGDTAGLGRVLVNLSDALAYSQPAAAAEAAHSAVGYLRRTGARDLLAVAIANEVNALLSMGDWDGAEAILGQAVDADGLADFDILECYRGWVAALRGDAATAGAILAALGDLRTSEDPQDRSLISAVTAFSAAVRGDQSAALRHALAALDHAANLGISNECLRWAWPLAARIAYQTADRGTTRELLAMLDGSQPGHLVPMLSAERDLVSARVAAQDGDPAATAALAAAVGRLRELSTPYHLAHGLLDQAQHLLRQGDTETAAGAVEEARSTATSLRCQPLLDRVTQITAAEPRIPA